MGDPGQAVGGNWPTGSDASKQLNC